MSNISESREKSLKRGRYHNDYSPRYQEAYDIYDKARNHMKSLKRQKGKDENCQERHDL